MEEEIWNEKYKVESKPKSAGCSGKVFLGYDLASGRKVAIKRMKSIGAAEHEFRVMSSWEENGFLPKVYDRFALGTDGCLVMEWAEGEVLAGWIKKCKQNNDLVVRIIIGILQGLRFLHKAGYLHKDLHSRNIIVNDNGVLAVKIVDFGAVVKKNKNGIWQGSQPIWRWEFIPPEQFEKVIILDDSSEVYVTAGLCVRLLTGKPPFKPSFDYTGETIAEAYRDECRRLHSRILECCEIYDWRLRKILVKATRVERSLRFKSAEEMMGALESLR